MTRADFQRRLPGSREAFARRPGWSRSLHLDLWLLSMLLCLSVAGLIVLYSASGSNLEAVQRQGTYLLFAYAVLLAVAQFPLDFYRRWAPWGYGLGTLLLVAVLLFGVGAKGAQRWLDLPGLPRFQPAELMKLLGPMTIASYLSRRVLPPAFMEVCVAVLLIGLPSALVVRQPDLGTAVLIAAAGCFVLFFAGLSWRYIAAIGVLLVAAVYPAWHFMLHEYQQRRILTMFNPESDKLGAGWNIIQSKTAIGSGGLEGKGWLQGTQSQLDFLPEGHTDFIIAALAEEFGLIGVLALLALYLAIIIRCLIISVRAQSTFARLLGGGLTLTFFIYVIVNMGMVAGIFPVVGVPLPLVSQGGTAVITLLAAFGCMMAISTEESRIVKS